MDRQAILKIRTTQVEAVDVPEWGGKVYIHSMSGADRKRFLEDREKVAGDMHQLSLVTLIRFLRNEDGTPIFTEADAPELEQQDARLLERLTLLHGDDRVVRLQGLPRRPVLGCTGGVGPEQRRGPRRRTL